VGRKHGALSFCKRQRRITPQARKHS
jgi:hypothetical protein